MKFQIWKTVILGLFQTIEAYRQALTNAGFEVDDQASDILDKIQVSQSQIQLDLVKIRVFDLGFKEKKTRYDQICAKAKELGLELCPAETGPALRMVYSDQPYSEWACVAMEPITDSFDDLTLFMMEHDFDAQWLRGWYADPSPGSLYPDNHFVFVLPRK